MDTWEKIKSFALNMQYEAAEDVQFTQPTDTCREELLRLKDRFPVTKAHLPNGKTIPLLKTMQTSVCERNCNYCCFRSGRDIHRASLSPDELASAVVKLSDAGVAKGVFLSSGITGGGIHTQDRIIATAEILRQKYRYPHYIHLKIMPGAEKDQIFRAMQLADRVSINLEGPNETSLGRLAPKKVFYKELLQPLRLIEDIRRQNSPHLAWKGSWPSSCTQFVVGAAGETDLDLLQTTANLRHHFGIRRAYYSRFTPVINTPFENLPPESITRQHRLYQAFYLLRDYQFDLEEIQFSQTGHLDLGRDPKLAWAEVNLRERPIEVNTADYEQLLKIPGIGPVSARKIILRRRYGKIRSSSDLRQLGIPPGRASRFILLDGQQPAYQPELFV
jgi:predicted DNA-binding helix-hairpin-helix protein